MSSGPSNFDVLVHQYGQSLAWCILLDLTAIFALMKYSRLAATLHAILGIVILLLTYFFILWFLVPYGFIQSQKQFILYYLHAIFGCAMLGFSALQAASGIITKYFLNSSELKLQTKKWIKNFHKFFAYFLAILFKINILWNWYFTYHPTFYFLISWQGVCLIIWGYLKFFLPQIQVDRQDKRAKDNKKQQIIQVKNYSEIQSLKTPFVIYNNYLYDASGLSEIHPGGKKVIQSILGREVDRFLYGMYSSQLCPQIPVHSHSSRSLNLLSKPLMKVGCRAPFTDFTEQSINVKVQFIRQISHKTKIYLLGLQRQRGQFNFEGYTDIKQLGQYYSLTMNNKITRLYTTVNFLTDENINLISKLLPQISLQMKYDNKLSKIQHGRNIELPLRGDKAQNLLNKDMAKQYLPIMLKIYNDGKFTSKLVEPHIYETSFELSQPKGLGIELQLTKPGKIVVVAGGTGLFPFSDLIDLLFKETFIKSNPERADEILSRNRILLSKPFQNFNFVFLIAINEPEDVHPITFYQLSYISKYSSKIKIAMRVSKGANGLAEQDHKIEFTKEYFTNRVIKQAEDKGFSRVWICGPPRMATETAQNLLRNKFARKDFLLL